MSGAHDYSEGPPIEFPAAPEGGELLDMILDEAGVQRIPLKVHAQQVGWAWVRERKGDGWDVEANPYEVIRTELF